jgi:hypothetical protein
MLGELAVVDRESKPRALDNSVDSGKEGLSSKDSHPLAEKRTLLWKPSAEKQRA